MSQFYDQASLVLVPSGYKSGKIYSQKPLSTSGELSFSRASNATRVNSSGLVEKVRENLVTYSEEFNLWTASDTTTTANAAANPLDGATTADKVIASATTAEHNVYFSRVSVIAEVTTSIYAKADGYNFLYLRNTSASGGGVWFNLSTGAVATQQSGRVGTITSVGNGWYRCSVTWNQPTAGTNQYLIVGPAPADNTATYLGDGTSGVLLFGAQMEFGVMTDYIATTSTAVSVGPVSGLPRLDYSGGASCPSLLLEPQATALLTFSEAFGNAAYTKLQMNVSENQAISPSGYQDADKIFGVSGQTNVLIYSAGLGANTYSVSIFVKAAEYSKFGLRESNSYGSYATFDLTQGTVLDTGNVGDGTVSNAKIEAYSNGWYRCSAVFGGDNNMNWGFIPLPNTYTTGQPYSSYTADGTSGVYIWGYNVTQTAYVQSYIPTLSSAVTRVADAASKTGISSLIGQTEGTIYVEFEHDITATAPLDTRIHLSSGTTANWIFFGFPDGAAKLLRFFINDSSGALSFYGSSPVVQGKNKVAFGYKSGDFVAYLNGTQVATNSTVRSIPVCSQIDLQGGAPNASAQERANIEQVLLFKTRLSNADLATLTTL